MLEDVRQRIQWNVYNVSNVIDALLSSILLSNAPSQAMPLVNTL